MDLSPSGLWASMGFIARFVAVVLLIMSIWSLYISFDRVLLFNKARKQSLAFARLATDHMKHDRAQAAIDAAAKFPQSHLARVVSAGLQSYQFESETSPLSDPEVVEAATRAVDRSALLTTADFKRGIGSLATIATTAPFIGLFGTVIGIINAFRAMASSGQGGLGAVSAGISEALFTTATGLLVAIPAVMMFNYFTNAIEAFVVDMNDVSSEVLSFVLREGRRRP